MFVDVLGEKMNNYFPQLGELTRGGDFGAVLFLLLINELEFDSPACSGSELLNGSK